MWRCWETKLTKNMKTLEVGQTIGFRLDKNRHGEGILQVREDGFWQVKLTQKVKEFEEGDVIFVWDEEIFY